MLPRLPCATWFPRPLQAPSYRSRRARLLTGGEPIVLVQEGRPIERNLRRERITLENVQEEARRSQIASLAELQWAILEDDGHISCIPRRH
jgi:uncharacterized membrane protein YcaP (DUF421 family)